MSTGSDHSAVEGVVETEEDRARVATRLAARTRKRREHERDRARRKAAIAAAPPPERCVVSARGAPISGNTTRSVSVHTLGFDDRTRHRQEPASPPPGVEEVFDAKDGRSLRRGLVEDGGI